MFVFTFINFNLTDAQRRNDFFLLSKLLKYFSQTWSFCWIIPVDDTKQFCNSHSDLSLEQIKLNNANVLLGITNNASHLFAF